MEHIYYCLLLIIYIARKNIHTKADRMLWLEWMEALDNSNILSPQHPLSPTTQTKNKHLQFPPP